MLGLVSGIILIVTNHNYTVYIEPGPVLISDKLCLITRFHEVSRPRDLCLKLSGYSEIWQSNQLPVKFQSDAIIKTTNLMTSETSWDLTIGKPNRYLNGAQDTSVHWNCFSWYYFHDSHHSQYNFILPKQNCISFAVPGRFFTPLCKLPKWVFSYFCR